MKLQQILVSFTGCFVIGFASFSMPAIAQIQPNCQNPQTQTELNICATRDAQAADQQLNQVYEEVRAKLDGTSETQLVNAQLAWIEFRDLTCAYERDRFSGGSAAPMVHEQCIARVTRQRTQDLQNYLREGA